MRIFLLIWLLAVLAAPAAAQQRGELHVNPGVRVRVTAPELAPDPVRGWVAALAADTLVLRTGARGVRLHIPRASVRSVEISTGRRTLERAVTWAGIGVLGGLVAGVAISAANDLDLASIPMTMGTMVLGGMSGAVVGASTAPERWMPVYSAPPRAAAAGERP